MMAEYRKIKTLTEVEAAYLAGIIDGEGTVTLTRRNKDNQRQLAVTISSTDRNLLEYVLDIVGAGKITNKTMSRSNHSPAFTYQLYNRQALTLLKRVAPFLRTYKKDRTKIVLQDYLKVTPRNGKYSPDMLRAKEEFHKAFFAFSAPNAKRLN